MEVLLLSGGGSTNITVTVSPSVPGEQLYKKDKNKKIIVNICHYTLYLHINICNSTSLSLFYGILFGQSRSPEDEPF